MDNDKPFKAFNVGTGPINLTRWENIDQFRPVEIHLKENGSLKDEPSFAIILTSPYSKKTIVGQISLEMLNDGLNDIGYEITKKFENKEPFLKK